MKTEISDSRKTDRYTKVVLTVIAVALVCLVLQNVGLTTPAQADTGTSSYGDVVDVRIVGTSGNIPVELEDHNLSGSFDAIPVELVDHDLSGSYDAIPVSVEN